MGIPKDLRKIFWLYTVCLKILFALDHPIVILQMYTKCISSVFGKSVFELRNYFLPIGVQKLSLGNLVGVAYAHQPHKLRYFQGKTNTDRSLQKATFQG